MYIVEMKGMRLGIKDEQYPVYEGLRKLLSQVRKRFRRASLWYHGLEGLCYCPCIEIHHKSLADFKRLLLWQFPESPYSLAKRGRKIEWASAKTDEFSISFDGEHTITISPVKKVFLEVLFPEVKAEAA